MRGAVGTIIINNVILGARNLRDPDDNLPPTPIARRDDESAVSSVVTVMIPRVEGLALILQIKNETKSAAIEVEALMKSSYNVIAQTTGGDQNNVLIVGAHSDSVPAGKLQTPLTQSLSNGNVGPGINDNGSGIITLLEVAQGLTNYTVNNAIRFVWFSGEEVGILGSFEYVHSLSQTELDKIALMLCFDMIASPNYVLGVYDGDGSKFNTITPPGSAAAEKLFHEYFSSVGLPSVELELNLRSDYLPFYQAGIPIGGLFTGAELLKTEEEEALFGGNASLPYDINYHAAGDTVDNLNPVAWIQNSKAIAHSIATYAISFKSLGIGRK